MATVTIRGSISPSAWLPRGEVRTVQRTTHIDNLIRGGYVDVIAEYDDPPVETPVEAAPEPAPEPAAEEAPESEPETAPRHAVEEPVQVTVGVSDPGDIPAEDEHPEA